MYPENIVSYKPVCNLKIDNLNTCAQKSSYVTFYIGAFLFSQICLLFNKTNSTRPQSQYCPKVEDFAFAN